MINSKDKEFEPFLKEYTGALINIVFFLES